MARARQRAGELWREETAERALQLYSQGHRGYRTVAAILSSEAQTVVTDSGVTTVPARKVSHQWVKRQVDKALAERIERTRDAADRWLNRELAALDAMEEALAEKVAEGDVNAIAARLRIMDRRARYLGMDAPVEISAVGSTVPDALRERVEQARERNARKLEQLTAGPATAGAEIVTAELVD